MRKKHIFIFWVTLCLVPNSGFSSPSAAARTRFLAEKKSAQQTLKQLDPAGALTIHWPPHRSKPSTLFGLQFKAAGDTPTARAQRFIRDYRPLFLDAQSTLQVHDLQQSKNHQVIRFQQFYQGLKVEGCRVIVNLDQQGWIRSVNSTSTPIVLNSTEPVLSARNAVNVVLTLLQKSPVSPSKTSWAHLIILAEGVARLVYKVYLPMSLDAQGRAHLVDALTGEYIGWRRGIIDEKRTLSHNRGDR